MAKPDDDTAASVADWLQRAEPAVRYDVDAGLQRHRELVTSGADLPDWAGEGTGAHRGLGMRWLRWLGTLVVLGGAGAGLWSGIEPGPTRAPARTAPVRATPSALPGTRAAESTRAPTPAEPPSPATPQHERKREEHPPASAQERPTAPDLAPAVNGEVEPADLPSDPAPAGANSVPSKPWRAATHGAPRRAHPTRTTKTASPDSRENQATSRDEASRSAQGELDTTAPQDGEEIRQLVRARQLLAVDPLRALKLVREGEIRFGEGYLRQERRYLEVRALRALGRSLEADTRAEWFVRDYPASPYTEQIRRR